MQGEIPRLPSAGERETSMNGPLGKVRNGKFTGVETKRERMVRRLKPECKKESKKNADRTSCPGEGLGGSSRMS